MATKIDIDWPSPQEAATVQCPKFGESIGVSTCWLTMNRGGDVGVTWACDFFDRMGIGAIYCNHPDACGEKEEVICPSEKQ